MLKVIADTNIYISALNFAGIPDEILSLARKEEIELFIISGDHHLRNLKNFQQIKIVSPLEFLGLWENQLEIEEK